MVMEMVIAIVIAFNVLEKKNINVTKQNYAISKCVVQPILCSKRVPKTQSS